MKAALSLSFVYFITWLAYVQISSGIIRAERDGEWYAQCASRQFIINQYDPHYSSGCRDAYEDFYKVLYDQSFIGVKIGVKK